MSIITLGHIPASGADTPVARPGFWRRALDRFIEARLRKAQEQIHRYHRFAWPRELEEGGWPTTGRGKDSLPFER
jgi:hypothetical protein